MKKSSESSDSSKSPKVTTYLDICGKHRKQVELNRLTKEISLLEEELKTLEGLPPASKCCTDVNKGQSISSWDRWFKEHSTDSECSCCCSCRWLKIWKFSSWKRFTCWRPTFRRLCPFIPSFSCCKFYSIKHHCTRCINCCNVCKKE
ncbi:guanine nucleotide-binding protein subunit gamma 2 isoform X2 [Cryptomeria japonica]|uniref:guanine nucleotide-binding protein subunit gamma 2 isoform X2 n=1 Tax=Cryptomeria japonica TaxID=3369 RepID=UPI0025AD743E|nr:guanine nucleotide-binding protein subunit gamma 2 isoform X2 [Cryptomeria japonica]